jgi:DNA-binding CsgD family transcriptional regulator
MVLQSGRLDVAIPEVSGIRVLARADLAVLLQRRPKTELKSLTDKHHRIARAIAAGLSNIDVAAICGITVTRVSMLKAGDQAFQELIAHYRGLTTADYLASMDSYMEVLLANKLKAEVMIGDKLDAAIDGDEVLPTRDLMAISRDAADRTGHGKINTNVNYSGDYAAKLEAARRRAAGARRSPSLVPESPSTTPAPALTLGPNSFRRL